jgi:DNA-directed RNA polymerase beta' subunit
MSEKRILTSKEIEDMLSFIKPSKNIPPETALSLVQVNKQRLRNQLEGVLIYPELIPKSKKNIKKMYETTKIQAGESVGIITAQSIGEKQTQSTLNSIDWTDVVLYTKDSNAVVEPIGQMVDRLMVDNKNEVKLYQKNKTEYLELPDGYYIPSCDEDGFNNWFRIEAVTRHLPSGKLVKVTTQSGRTVMASQCKSFLVWNDSTFEPTLGSDVKIGDILPTTKQLTIKTTVEYLDFETQKILLDGDFGFLVGIYLATDFITTHNYGRISQKELSICHSQNKNKIVPMCAYTAPKDFIEGLINGYQRFVKTQYISQEIITGIAFLQTYFGIFTGYDDSQGNYPQERDVYFDRVVKIEHVDATMGLVYDFTIAKTRNFQLFNGLNIRDSFHKAGSSENEVDLVSRFSELLNASKAPKSQSCFIYFSSGNSTIEDLRKTIGSSLVELTMEKITKNFKVEIDKEDEVWYIPYELLIDNSFRNYTDCISVDINTDILFTYKLTLQDVADKLTSEYSDMSCVCSPENFGRIDVFVDTRNIDLPEERIAFVDQDNAREIYLEEVVQPVLEKILIAGISKINQIFFNKDAETTGWMIETSGSNFPALLAHPKVDMKRVLSNNVWDIYNALGVEAARQFMIDQFSSIMPGINTCHIMLLVDKMTYKGGIASISRYTMRTDEGGVLARSSFEETLSHLLGAGIYGQHEPVHGVSASIICGKQPNVGTGVCKVKMNLEMIKEEEEPKARKSSKRHVDVDEED